MVAYPHYDRWVALQAPKDQNQCSPCSALDDYSSELNIPPHQLHFLRQPSMTPQLARQKASDLSYEIGALLKIKERLERQRESLLMYCMSDVNSSSS